LPREKLISGNAGSSIDILVAPAISVKLLQDGGLIILISYEEEERPENVTVPEDARDVELTGVEVPLLKSLTKAPETVTGSNVKIILPSLPPLQLTPSLLMPRLLTTGHCPKPKNETPKKKKTDSSFVYNNLIYGSIVLCLIRCNGK